MSVRSQGSASVPRSRVDMLLGALRVPLGALTPAPSGGRWARPSVGLL